uniref:Y-chromosome-specific anti-Mullerian hormone-like protein b n=1 Tax=Esox lucius TaxID=8010 RepID=A0A5C0B7N5_ESOLU|nr:Y-chromosome-specific anti-Mullerian hormone-like protein b [Esox lucius]
MRLSGISCMLLFLPSVIGTVTHQGTLSASLLGESLEDTKPDHQGTGLLAVLKGSWEVEKGLGENPSTVEKKITIHPHASHHLLGDTTCFGKTLAHREVIEDMLSALRTGWDKKNELRQADLTQFGVCSNSDDSVLVAALSTLVIEANKQRHGLHVWQPIKELTEGEEEGWGLVLTLHLPQPPLSKIKPILILAFRNPITRDFGTISFTSHALQPYKQTLCISEGTQFLILTGMPSEGKSNLEWKIVADQNLLELQGILGEGTSVISLVPFSMDRGMDERVTERQDTPPAPSGTYTFLCELQRFLSDVLPQLKQSKPLSTPVPLFSLHSPPPLSLGVSSSETILAELLNSSAPTMFSLPTQCSEFQGYHGELSLQPALQEVLRQRLEEVVVRMRAEEVGSAGMHRLRRLQELSFLPTEGKEPPTGAGNSSEMQYRALLLLKALQTVVGSWEVKRERRDTRAGQEQLGQGDQCQLHSLTVSLEEFKMYPSEANIFHCHGVCSFPLINSDNTHAILLNREGLQNSLCCVPLDYEDLRVIQLKPNGLEIIIKPNMVATKCGCR